MSQPQFWAATGVVAGPYLFVRGLQGLRLKGRIQNVPHSRIRGAAMGSIQVSGRAVGPYTVVAPLSKEDCLYYRLVVIEDPQGHFSKSPKEISVPLFLDDGTGQLMVYPCGAELRFKPSHQEGSLGRAAEGYRSGQNPDFVQEFSIKPGDTIFVLGTLRENTWLRKNTENSVGSDGLSRIGPGFVNKCEADLLRQDTFPLLDSTVPSGEAPDASSAFDLYPPAILMQGDGPLVISKDSQRELVSKLSWKSALYTWGGALWSLWAVSEILGHTATWKWLLQLK
jgi:hypothetical protein